MSNDPLRARFASLSGGSACEPLRFTGGAGPGGTVDVLTDDDLVSALLDDDGITYLRDS